MEYKISNSPPDVIYEEAKRKWGVDFENTIFTVGDTIHTKYELSPDLLAHELVHVRQQTEMGTDKWWRKYFSDEFFRLEQEVEAYGAQYKWVLDNKKDRNVRALLLRAYAKSLSGKMYGDMISFEASMESIENNAK